ncbi:hypothetical protein [Pseudomonas asplenii]|uniref:hypothetical protein n=1 Tax=Pseudomonas asplenii TaxID=53407 RepID=UPI001364CCCF
MLLAITRVLGGAGGKWPMQPGQANLLDIDPVAILRPGSAALESQADAVLVQQGEMAWGSGIGEEKAGGSHGDVSGGYRPFIGDIFGETSMKNCAIVSTQGAGNDAPPPLPVPGRLGLEGNCHDLRQATRKMKILSL